MKTKTSGLVLLAIIMLATAAMGSIASAAKQNIYVGGSMTYSAYDINMDGKVDMTDVNRITDVYGETGKAGWIREDTNKDGKVNVADMSGVTCHYGETNILVGSITVGIAKANKGDIITVRPGKYMATLYIDKAITLQSETKGKAIIDGLGMTRAVNIGVSGVVISGFVIQDANTGIYTTCKGNTYKDNTFSTCKTRINDIATPYTLK